MKQSELNRGVWDQSRRAFLLAQEGDEASQASRDQNWARWLNARRGERC